MKRFAIAFATGLATLAFVASPALADEHKDEKKKKEWKKFQWETSDGKHSVEVGSRVQFRFTQEEPEVGDSTGSFRIRRAKFSLKGKAYEDFKYKIQAVWSGGSTTLEDAHFQYTKNKLAQPWFGQGKVFFGRQLLTSSGKQQFVDRSLASGVFTP